VLADRARDPDADRRAEPAARKIGTYPIFALRPNRGFTLIEIMVVVVILGILAALIVPKIMSRPDEARIAAAKQDVATLAQALEALQARQPRVSHHRPGTAGARRQAGRRADPRQLEDPAAISSACRRIRGDGTTGYLNPGRHGEIDIYSLGADGEPGGEGNDADIGNW
jgi:general secretion pathway protein G